MADATNTLQSLKQPLPDNIANEIWTKVQQEAVLPRLAGAMPQKFGKTDVMVLTGTPKAQIVGESDAKGATSVDLTTKQVTPVKLHAGIRVSDEFIWGDDDYRLGVMNLIKDQLAKSLVDALDEIGIHKTNPATGVKTAKVSDAICDTTNVVTLTAGKEDEAIDEAITTVLKSGYAAKGIAADVLFDDAMTKVRDKNNRKMYENGVNGYRGLNSVTGFVKGTSDIEAVVGDFSSFKWGVQKEIPMQVIQFGDPDNTGRDLAGHNEVFVRAEVVYGVGIMDLDAFCLIKDEAAEPAKPSQGGSDNA